MKEIKNKEKVAKDIVSPENDFKGYTIEEIRFHRALVAMEADFCKAKILKNINNLQSLNPLSGKGTHSLPGKAGSVVLRLLNGLNYMDYIFLGWSLFNGGRKIFSFFRKSKK